MSALAKTLLALGLLVVTNLATFGWATWRCRQEAEGQQRLLAEATGQAQAARAAAAAAEQQLESVRVWRELVELQRDISAVEVALNRLNFGDAIGALERVEGRLERGEYGQTFQQRRSALLPDLLRAKERLRATDPAARIHRADFEQAAFRLLAGGSAGGAAAGPRAAGAVTPTPAPTPGADAAAAPSPAPSPSPSPVPSPTASPAAPPGGPA